MERDPLDRPTSPGEVRALLAAEALSPAAAARALQLAAGTPAPALWLGYLRTGLLVVGATLLLTGVIFFFAYNWADLGRFEKLGIISAGIVACAVTGWRQGASLAGNVSLFGASILVGALLAVYGQAYQTGADPYELFTAWMLLIAPWTIAARTPAFFALQLVLANVAVTLFWIQVLDRWARYGFHTELSLVLFGVTAAAFVAFELFARRDAAGSSWFSRSMVVWCSAMLCWPTVEAALTRELGAVEWMAILFLAGAVGGLTLFFSRGPRRDLFLVAVIWAAALIPIDTAIGRKLFEDTDNFDFDAAPFFVLGMLVIGEVGALVTVLRHLGREPRLEMA